MNSLLFAIIGIQNLEITWETILNVGCPKSDSIRSVTPPPLQIVVLQLHMLKLSFTQVGIGNEILAIANNKLLNVKIIVARLYFFLIIFYCLSLPISLSLSLFLS